MRAILILASISACVFVPISASAWSQKGPCEVTITVTQPPASYAPAVGTTSCPSVTTQTTGARNCKRTSDVANCYEFQFTQKKTEYRYFYNNNNKLCNRNDSTATNVNPPFNTTDCRTR